MQDKKIDTVFSYFTELFGDNPKCELNYDSDIDLLVAIILSAQCTDKRVNAVTANLFKKYRTVGDYAVASPADLEKLIYSTGFYHNKSKNIIAMARSVVDSHGGVIPADMDALIELDGVGRKTASVFLAEFHGVPAIAVDTHVGRVSRRLGFTKSHDPVQIERDLKKLFDDTGKWHRWHLYMVLFGRYKCKSQNPNCAGCRIAEYCNYSVTDRTR